MRTLRIAPDQGGTVNFGECFCQQGEAYVPQSRIGGIKGPALNCRPFRAVICRWLFFGECQCAISKRVADSLWSQRSAVVARASKGDSVFDQEDGCFAGRSPGSICGAVGRHLPQKRHVLGFDDALIVADSHIAASGTAASSLLHLRSHHWQVPMCRKLLRLSKHGIAQGPNRGTCRILIDRCC